MWLVGCEQKFHRFLGCFENRNFRMRSTGPQLEKANLPARLFGQVNHAVFANLGDGQQCSVFPFD